MDPRSGLKNQGADQNATEIRMPLREHANLFLTAWLWIDLVTDLFRMNVEPYVYIYKVHVCVCIYIYCFFKYPGARVFAQIARFTADQPFRLQLVLSNLLDGSSKIAVTQLRS